MILIKYIVSVVFISYLPSLSHFGSLRPVAGFSLTLLELGTSFMALPTLTLSIVDVLVPAGAGSLFSATDTGAGTGIVSSGKLHV